MSDPYEIVDNTDETRHRERREERSEKCRKEAVTKILNQLELSYCLEYRIGKYRVDMCIDMKFGRYLFEIDPSQHKSYSVPAEFDRILYCREWAQDRCGQTVFVRFNPDAFQFDGRDCRAIWETRKDILIRLLSKYKPRDMKFQIIFLYYDMDADGMPTILKDPHVPNAIRECTVPYSLSGDQ